MVIVDGVGMGLGWGSTGKPIGPVSGFSAGWGPGWWLVVFGSDIVVRYVTACNQIANGFLEA